MATQTRFELGNAKLRMGRLEEAVTHYTEAINDDPLDPRGYNNRALAYTKLGALSQALTDAEKAIEIDPSLCKGYFRKSVVLSAMGQHGKSMEAARSAFHVSKEKSHSAEIMVRIREIEADLKKGVLSSEAPGRESSELCEKRCIYQFTSPSANNLYPPHLAVLPSSENIALNEILGVGRQISNVNTILARAVGSLPGDPHLGQTIQSLVDRNQQLRRQRDGMYKFPNIGDRNDWYTDDVFAQQQFTGVNPTTIESASAEWIDRFRTAACVQSNWKADRILAGTAPDSDPQDSFYIQDNSYFREAVDVAPDTLLQSHDHQRFACATVSLFHLTAKNGKLHPIAICLDYKCSIKKSVVIFNQRLRVADDTSCEATDWPWRYAKTCAQVADWTRHEITVHLVNTHFVEEVTIVAAHRAIPEDHILYRLLSPHWLKTLPLNASARSHLVPKVIKEIVGFPERLVYQFILDAYKRFDWVKMYVPNDLERRGFPIAELQDTKFHNYAYGRDVLHFWNLINTFVRRVLSHEYPSDAAVERDPAVQGWVSEIRDPDGGSMQSFPEIRSLTALVDAVTACIHIASPQHSSINYLQHYFLSFVINRPPALHRRIPPTLSSLQQYTELDLMQALPINEPFQWFLASQIPYILSDPVSEDENLLSYAFSVSSLAPGDPKTANLVKAAKRFREDIQRASIVFQENSLALDDQTVPYMVLDPRKVAVSILL
ncbi:hypothetical protein FRC17_009342 [Serendipita sp. 399]|nr:hypothetical protein FRC17_009342 [Serendipita sp. 399]